MKIIKFKVKTIVSSFIIIFLIGITPALVSCGPFKPKPVDLRKIPGGAKEKRERNVQEGRGWRVTNPLNRQGGNFQFASSNEMWRASLELLDFTPLQNVDYSGGIIVTDWFNEKEDQDSLKITIRFLSNEIRADGIKVIIHKRIIIYYIT